MTLRIELRRALGGCAFASAAITPLALPQLAVAEDAPAATPGTKTMPTVVVQADRLPDEQEGATKTPLSIRETPQSISVITRDAIEARQVMDLGGAIELSAGASAVGRAFAGNNPRTGEQFFLRGQELSGARDVRVDGFSAGGDRNNFDLAPFESVEVVKGPSSMLYGQGSLGGFINLVRKKPQADRGVNVAFQAGSYDTFRTEIDVAGALNSSETVLGQGTLAYEDSGSFIDGVQSKRLVVAPSVEWSLGENTRIAADVLYQDDDFTPSLGIPLRQDGSELVEPDVPRSFFFGVPSTEESKASALHTTLKVEQNLSDTWLASLLLHYSRNRLVGIADSYGYGIDEVGNTSLYSSFVAHDNDNWAGELRLDGRFDAFGRNHHVLLGVEKNKLEFLGWGGGGYPYIGTANIYDGFEDAVTVPGHSNPRNYNARDTGTNEAIYAQLLAGLTESTRLLLGARYDRTENHNVFASIDFDPFDEVQDSDAVTLRVGLTQDLGKAMTAYAVYAESFNPVYGLSLDGPLDPETGTGYELGAKGEWFDGRFGATAAIYRQELDNRPIPDPDNFPGESWQISGGLQRTDGVELEANGSPLPGWTVNAAASWIDGEYIDPLDADNFGKTPGGIIKRQIALYTNYELQSGPLKGFGVGATVLSVGDRIVLSGDNFFVKGYERLDLHFSYNALPNWNLSLLVRNVTDETYVERPNSAYLYGHFYGAPRSVMLRAEYDVASR